MSLKPAWNEPLSALPTSQPEGEIRCDSGRAPDHFCAMSDRASWISGRSPSACSHMERSLA
jgi:hypothetical protein